MLTLVQIVKERLQAEGFDGLYIPGECACAVSDLMPCGEPTPECRAGYKGGEGDEFHIGPTKPQASERA